MRVDFAEWLNQLPERRRHIAEALGRGDMTGSVAKQFNISPGRVSQVRRELNDNWIAFHGQAQSAANAVDGDPEAQHVCLPEDTVAINRSLAVMGEAV
jgi:FixJ family two-component response regulator